MINVTNNEMTRFFMSLPQAVKLVLKSATLAQGSEIFILKMPSIKTVDLARVFIGKYFPQGGVNIRLTNTRAGEKIHETLINSQENYKQIFENDQMLILVPKTEICRFAIADDSYPNFTKIEKLKNYSSQDFIDIEKIKNLI